MKRSTRGAIAVFVKTPGLSPLKTRLAADLGEEAARVFYVFSVRAMEQVVRTAAKASKAVAYWAVAEENGLSHPLWTRLKKIGQGDGGLGSRLFRVYDQLLARHGRVVLLGADAPQISPALVGEALDSLAIEASSPKFVLGRARDGGFYLVGGNATVPRENWEAVPYSADNTADQLAARLRELGPIIELPPRTDIDRADDMESAALELDALPSRLIEQETVLMWLRVMVTDRRLDRAATYRHDDA